MVSFLAGQARTVAEVEQEIQQLYQIATFALPLLAAFLVAAIAVYYRIIQTIRRNQELIGATIRATNGQLTEVHSAVQALTQHAGGTARTRAGDYQPAGPTADTPGTAVPEVPAPDAPVGVQPPPGDQQPLG